MPVKGAILLFVIAIVIAVFNYKKIYSWLSSEFSDEEYIEKDNDNSKEEKEE